MLHCLNDRGGNSTMQAQVPKQDAKVQHESAISCHFLKKNALFAKFFVWLESQLDIFGMETQDWRENWQVTKQKIAQQTLKNYSKTPNPR